MHQLLNPRLAILGYKSLYTPWADGYNFVWGVVKSSM